MVAITEAHTDYSLGLPITPIPVLSNQPLPVTAPLFLHGLELLHGLEVGLAGAALA